MDSGVHWTSLSGSAGPADPGGHAENRSSSHRMTIDASTGRRVRADRGHGQKDQALVTKDHRPTGHTLATVTRTPFRTCSSIRDGDGMTRAITDHKHMLLTTFRRNGAGVPTPVWMAPVSDGRIGMWTGAGTGKYLRLRHDPHVTVQACTARGRIRSGAPLLEGTAQIVQSGPLFEESSVAFTPRTGG